MLALSPSDIQNLKSSGFNLISIVDTAGDIENLSASQIQAAAALGVSTITITSTETAVALQAAAVMALVNAGIDLVVPASDTVTVTGIAADIIENLTASQIQSLAAIGVTTISSDASVVLSTLEATDFVHDAPNITITAPANDSVTVVGTATDLQELDPSVIAGLAKLGVTAFTVNDDVRPVFDLAQEDAIAVASITVNEPVGVTPLYLSQLPGYDFLPGTTYSIVDTATDIHDASASTLQTLSPQITSLVSNNGSVVLTVAQAEALENAALPVTEPSGDSVAVVDIASNLENMSLNQLEALGAIEVPAIAASDTLPMFSAAQMNALGLASVAVVAPPGSTQNDGTTVISGPNGSGLTFDITWDSSVASAPAKFKTDVEEAFQFYADEFDNPITLYYNVGFGEVNGTAMERGANGESSDNYEPAGTWSYSQLLTALQNDAQSAAQKMAVQIAQHRPDRRGELDRARLGSAGIGPAGRACGFRQQSRRRNRIDGRPPIGPSTDPNQGPSNTSEIDLIGVAEHEIAEGMGRVSEVNTAATAYSPIDLFRFSGTNDDRALTSTANPSYFSIDDGATRLRIGTTTTSTTGTIWATGPNTPIRMRLIIPRFQQLYPGRLYTYDAAALGGL